jgi:hypothetical protein
VEPQEDSPLEQGEGLLTQNCDKKILLYQDIQLGVICIAASGHSAHKGLLDQDSLYLTSLTHVQNSWLGYAFGIPVCLGVRYSWDEIKLSNTASL